MMTENERREAEFRSIMKMAGMVKEEEPKEEPKKPAKKQAKKAKEGK